MCSFVRPKRGHRECVERFRKPHRISEGLTVTKGKPQIRISIFDVVNHLGLALLGLITGFPFVYVILGSLTRSSDFRVMGVSLSPFRWTLDAFRYLLAPGSAVRQGLSVSIGVTCVGTVLSVVTTAALAYGLGQEELPGRRAFVSMILFTMMFQGGMVPLYLVVRGLGLTDTLASLVLPCLVNAFFLLVAVKFFEALPGDIQDAARVDGFLLPLSKPILATMALFYAVDYWNQWFWPMLFLRDRRLFPLQTVLRSITSSQQMGVLQMAAIVISALPILVLVTVLQEHLMGGVVVAVRSDHRTDV